MKMKMKKIMFVSMALLMVIGSIGTVLAADDWTTGASYSIGDIVTYQGTDYECVQPHTSQAGWNPVAVSALWQEYVAPPTGNGWGAGISYNVGDEVMYEGQLYTVRQAHTSQSDWIPSAVLALYKPKVETTVVTYLPPESNYEPSDYTQMSRADMISFMDFQYVDAQQKDEYLEYTWNYLHPQFNGLQVEWLYKPISTRLYYTDIEKCFDAYTEQQCFNGLVLGTTTISYTENNETETVTSVLDKTQSSAISAVDYAIDLQTEIVNTIDLNIFEPSDMNFVIN